MCRPRAGRQPLVHILTCGVEVCPGWADAALRHFDDSAIAGVAVVVVHRDDPQKIISAGLGYRAEGTAWRLGQRSRPERVGAASQEFCGPDLLAAFYRRAAVEAVGGFSPWLGDGPTSVDLAIALRRVGFRFVLEPRCLALTDDAVMGGEPAFRRGRYAERLFWRWASHHGWPTSLLGHTALLAGQSVVGLWRPSRWIEFAGRACGAVESLLFGRNPKRPEPSAVTTFDGPSVIASPHFGATRRGRQERPSRVA